MKSFQIMWEESELLSKKVLEGASDTELLSLIVDLVNDYKKISSENYPDEIKNSIKKRYMGELLFYITAVSARDNINVYAALKEQMVLMSV